MKRSLAFGGVAIALCIGVTAPPALRAQKRPAPASPAPPAAIARFAYNGNAAELPATFIDNLIFLQVRVNQSQPSLFQLNTTAPVSSVDPQRAADLGVTDFRTPVLNLTGLDFSLSELGSVANNEFAARVGRVYEGTLGNDVLSSVVVEIDYGRHSVRMYDPAAFHYTGRGKTLPLTMRDGMPAVKAKVDAAGHKSGEVLFILNTALDAPLLISDRYAQRHHFFSHLKTIPLGPGELGIGGNAVMARAERFQIGPFEVDDALVAFAQGEFSGADDSEVAGEIGGGMLRRFMVTLDYARGTASFASNSEIRTDDHENMSGISVAAGGPNLRRFEVTFVRPGSPAADAGIKKGDVIEAIDDEAAADITLSAIRGLFQQVGHKYKVLIDRDGKTQTIGITMRRSL
jgi:hypothetical protein